MVRLIARCSGLAALALVFAACDGGGQPGLVSLTLGGTAFDGSGYAPLEGRQPLVPGSQGGFHVWLKYRVRGMLPGKVRLERTARRVSDERLLLTATGTSLVGPPAADGAWELPEAIASFMCPSPLGVNLIDEEVRFELVVKDEDGVPLVVSSATAIPYCPDGDQAAFCQRICSGQ